MTPVDRTYHGWQHERVNFLFGLTGRRTAVVAAAVLLAAAPLAAAHLSGAVVAWPLSVLLLTLSCLRVAGRTLDEWMVTFVSFRLLKLRGHSQFRSGAFAPRSDGDPLSPAPMDLPGMLAPVRILEAETGSGAVMAVLHHPHERTWTAVARIGFPGIGLADAARHDAQVAAWGRLLAGLCVEGYPIVRVQALQRTVPDDGAELSRWHADHLAAVAPMQAAVVTAELLAMAVPTSVRREAYLAFTMDERRAAAGIRAAGGGEAGACAVLVRHVRALAGAISDAELEVSDWLAPRELAEVIRTGFDPGSAQPLAQRRAAQQSALLGGRPYPGLAAGVDPGLAGPVAADASWGSYQHDSAVSVSYLVYDWPRSQVYATALFPLLGDGTARRALSVYFQPLSPRDAERRVLTERTQRDVAIRMRQRTGQVVPEHERAALRRADAQDAARSAGHGLVRFTGYISVTVTEPGELADAMTSLEADAAAARIEIRRMWGAQDVGFALAALPAGLGLPRRRW